MMLPSAWLFDFLKKWETLRLTAFKPTPNDVWTIGWGHTRGVREGMTCTEEQANQWLREDVYAAVEDINVHCKRCFPQNPKPITQNEFDALVSLVYNIGPGAFNKCSLLNYLNAADDTDAAAQFLVWDKQHGEVLRGLLLRRQQEEAHFVSTT